MTDQHRAKMAPLKEAPAGLETDGQGNVIPFDQRTKDDQDKVRHAIADKLHHGPVEGAPQPANTTPK
jgi:hypothetical protein